MALYNTVRALERGLEVLRATNSLAEPTVEAISRATKIPWSTTFRLLETLEATGYVSRSQNGRTYRPTLSARALGEGYVNEALLAQFATPRVEELSAKILWPIDLFVFDNDAMLTIESTQRTSPFSIDRNMVGRRAPMLLTSSGRAYISNIGEQERISIIERLKKKNDTEGQLARNSKKLDALIERCRKKGYATREGGLFPHTKSISAPIIPSGRISGCISVVWIASALTMKDGEAHLAEPVKAAAAIIASDFEASVRRSDPAQG